MPFQARPHTSGALQHLRFGITALAAVGAACLLAQMLVWASIHFTDAAWLDPEAEAEIAQIEVVVSEADVPGDVPKGADVASPDAVDANRVLSSTGITLRRASGVVQTIGVIALFSLTVLMIQAVVIAGGANVPGVEQVVTACTWTILVAALALPLGNLLPEVPFKGIFVSFDTLTQEAADHLSGAPGVPSPAAYFTMHLALPVLLLVGLVVVIFRFRAGVEAGVIVTSVSQIDERLEKEIRSMKLGKLASPRAMGALNTAIGDAEPETAPPQPFAPPSSPGPGPASPMTRPPDPSSGGSSGRPI